MLYRISAVLAVLFGLFLAGAEAYRNWGDWQWWPFWVVDYLAVVLLLVGAVAFFRHKTRVWLAGGWGFTVAMFYMSFFSHVNNLREGVGRAYGPGGSVDESSLTMSIGILLGLAALGFVLALLPSRERS